MYVVDALEILLDLFIEVKIFAVLFSPTYIIYLILNLLMYQTLFIVFDNYFNKKCFRNHFSVTWLFKCY